MTRYGEWKHSDNPVADAAFRVVGGLVSRLDYRVQATFHAAKIECPPDILTSFTDLSTWINEAREALREKAV